jgi:hypothetical protein
MGRRKLRLLEKAATLSSYSGITDAEEALQYSKHKHHTSIENKE